jgi:hypothetical protein
VWSHF